MKEEPSQRVRKGQRTALRCVSVTACMWRAEDSSQGPLLSSHGGSQRLNAGHQGYLAHAVTC